MLSALDYENLVKALDNSGGNAFISAREYLAAHYLPNWYPLISEYTPETKFYSVKDNLENELQALGWDVFFTLNHSKLLLVRLSIAPIKQKKSLLR